MFASKNNQKGFTLIELLVVISIISLLASVVLSALNTARAKARDARRYQDLDQLRTALEAYAFDHNGAFPSPGHTWSLRKGDGTAYDWNLLQTSLAPYMTAIPTDPINNTTYTYFYTPGFSTGWDSSGTEGTCLGKAIIKASSVESGSGRHECTLNSGVEQYPNEIVLMLN